MKVTACYLLVRHVSGILLTHFFHHDFPRPDGVGVFLPFGHRRRADGKSHVTSAIRYHQSHHAFIGLSPFLLFTRITFHPLVYLDFPQILTIRGCSLGLKFDRPILMLTIYFLSRMIGAYGRYKSWCGFPALVLPMCCKS